MDDSAPNCPQCGETKFIVITTITGQENETEKLVYITCYKCNTDNCLLEEKREPSLGNQSPIPNNRCDDRRGREEDGDLENNIEGVLSFGDDHYYFEEFASASGVPASENGHTNRFISDQPSGIQNLDGISTVHGENEYLFSLGDIPSQNDINARNGSSITNDEIVESFASLMISQPCSECNACSIQRLNIEDSTPIFECSNCSKIIELDYGINFSEILHAIETPGLLHVNPCECGNSDHTKFKTEKDESDLGTDYGTVRTKCLICNKARAFNELEFVLDIDERDIPLECDDDMAGFNSDITLNTNGTSVDKIPANIRHKNSIFSGRRLNDRKTQIRSIAQLKQGDHITWHRGAGYWHHAIVVKVYSSSLYLVRVIHYGSAKALNSLSVGVTVREEDIEVNPSKEQLYRFDYNPGDCYPSDKVIENARKRLGERRYNPIANNCEHFVRQCKTGLNESYQSNKLRDRLKQCQSYMHIGSLLEYLPKLKGTNLLLKGSKVGLVSVSGEEAAIGPAMISAAEGEARMLVTPGALAGAGLIAGVELASTAWDIRKAYYRKKNGEISRGEFIKVVIRRTSSAAGSIILLIPFIFLPYAWLLLPLAHLVGRAIGAMIGRWICKQYDKIK